MRALIINFNLKNLSVENYKNGGIFNFLANHENFENFQTHEHDLIDGPSIIAGGSSIPMA